jgi:hypothetical protein
MQVVSFEAIIGSKAKVITNYKIVICFRNWYALQLGWTQADESKKRLEILLNETQI